MSRIHPRLFTPAPALLIASCPLSAAWRDCDKPGDKDTARRMSEEELAICAAARRTRPIRRWYRVPLFWERARDEQADAMHMHAEALINQRLVHIDYFTGIGDQGSGIRRPGSGIGDVGSERSERSERSESRDPAGGIANTNDREGDQSVVEIWIFVDGRLSGCAGASFEGGCSLPAVACIQPALAISVDDAMDGFGPVVELWAVE